MRQIIDSHFPVTVVGSIDPRAGVAFHKGFALENAATWAGVQAIQSNNMQFRFADIKDEQLRKDLSELSWNIFHITQPPVHKTHHGRDLVE
jgi:hypothetical protein